MPRLPRRPDWFTALALTFTFFLVLRDARGDDTWVQVLQENIGSEYSETRHNALKQVDASTVKGLKAIWSFLDRIAPKDPLKYDWYVREGAYEALMSALGSPEAEAEIADVLDGSGKPESKEAIVYSVIWKIRKQFEEDYGENNDEKIKEAKYLLSKTRGVEYFKLVLPSIRRIDPEKKFLGWIKKGLEDKGSQVRIAALVGLMAYPDTSSIPLLLEHLRNLEKRKTREFKEWIFTRFALETLSGQNFGDDVTDWHQWWAIAKDTFSIEKRIEEETEGDDSKGRTRVVNTGGVEVTVNLKIAGAPEGYPLLVLPWLSFEPDYFRPYFHGIEEHLRVFYVQMPQIDDFKGLARDANTNLIVYPTDILADALAKIMEETKLEHFAILAHGPSTCNLAYALSAKFSDQVSHLLLINPVAGGSEYGKVLDHIEREGRRRQSKELENGAKTLRIGRDNKPLYEPSDAAEQAGIGRALTNVRFSDPSSPEVGALQFLYRLPGTQVLNDSTWSLQKIFEDKPRINVAVLIGEQDPWAPSFEVNRVTSFLRNATVIKFPRCAEDPFIADPGLFTTHVLNFFKRTGAIKIAKD